MKSRSLFWLLSLGGVFWLPADPLRADQCYVVCNTYRETLVEKKNQEHHCCQCKWLQATAQCYSTSDKNYVQKLMGGCDDEIAGPAPKAGPSVSLESPPASSSL